MRSSFSKSLSPFFISGSYSTEQAIYYFQGDMVMSAQMNSDTKLIEASTSGDKTAFEAIVKKYQSFICAITFSATGDLEKSEELAQQTFVSAWKDLCKLKDHAKFQSWLAAIARNIIKNSFRSQARDPIAKAAPIDRIEDSQTADSGPVESAINKEQQAVVRLALKQIPQMYREPLVLFYRQQQSVKQVAQQLELSEDTVKQRLSRGRNLLKEQIAAMVQETISRSGPGKAFTTMVMTSVTALAVKTSTAAVASTSGTQTATGSLIAGTAAKLLTAAAVVALGAGAVLMYKQMNKTSQEPDLPQTINTLTARDITPDAVETPPSSDYENTNIQAQLIQEQTTIQNKPAKATALLAAPAKIQKIKNSPTVNIDWQPIQLDTDDANYNHLLFVKEDTAGGSDVRTLAVAGKQEHGWKIRPIHSAQSYECTS
jgi:RNA polymerase sigma factor (sigma-70 family)